MSQKHGCCLSTVVKPLKAPRLSMEMCPQLFQSCPPIKTEASTKEKEPKVKILFLLLSATLNLTVNCHLQPPGWTPVPQEDGTARRGKLSSVFMHAAFHSHGHLAHWFSLGVMFNTWIGGSSSCSADAGDKWGHQSYLSVFSPKMMLTVQTGLHHQDAVRSLNGPSVPHSSW